MLVNRNLTFYPDSTRAKLAVLRQQQPLRAVTVVEQVSCAGSDTKRPGSEPGEGEPGNQRGGAQ